MRPIPSLVHTVLAIGVSIATGPTVAAQEPTAAPRLQAELADGLFTRAVLEAPFTAEAVTTWTPPDGSGRPVYRSRSRLDRDRAGRVRVEQTFAGQPESPAPHRVFVRPDPQGAVVHMLDTVARTAVEVPLGFANMSTATPARLAVPVAMDCVISFYRPQTLLTAVESGGTDEVVGYRLVHGVLATGTRLATTLAWPAGSAAREVTDQRWVSHDLGIVLQSRTADPALGIVEHEVTRLSLAEPAPRTFELPAEFAPGRPFWPFTMANPHAMLTWGRGLAPCERPSR